MSEPLTMSKVHEDFIRSLHKTEGATATHLLAELDATRAALQKAEEEYLALNKVHLEFVAESIKRFAHVEAVARELLALANQGFIRADGVAAIARATALLGDPPAVKPVFEFPKEGEIVIVYGGIAQYRGGKFYTGMEWPLFERAIQWEVDYWMPLPTTPASAGESMGEGGA